MVREKGRPLQLLGLGGIASDHGSRNGRPGDGAAHTRGRDDVRQINDSVRYAPAIARYRSNHREVHMLSTAAFHAFLKKLEEPPEHAKFGSRPPKFEKSSHRAVALQRSTCARSRPASDAHLAILRRKRASSRAGGASA